MYFETKKLSTERIGFAYHHAGKKGAPRLLFIHGNCSSSLFYLPLMKRLEDKYEMIAVDLRGFGETEPLPIDATRGMRDFSDDIEAFVTAIGWERFSILGWSMGGGVAMQYAIDHSAKLEGIILEAPLSPYGFGGTYGADGKKLQPEGLASGGGCANAQLIGSLQSGERSFIEKTIDGVYVAPPYRIDSELKEMFIDSVLTTRVGDGLYPGDKSAAPVWPFFVAGKNGVCNTMAPNYCDLSPIADIPVKPDILWIRGAGDIMVSDTSLMDLAWLGRLGMIPGWPGEEQCPNQPMLSQTRHVLDRYRENGGRYKEVVIPGGHGCMLDNEEGFAAELVKFMEEKKVL